MALDYLHTHPIMHSLYGLQQLGLRFELKGGKSLSKGFGLIHRFSEDIDIRIEPPEVLDVKTGRNHTKRSHIIIAENEAFLLSTPAIRQLYERAYEDTATLYYREQPSFADILQAISHVIARL